jgi:hypothetical protein
MHCRAAASCESCSYAAAQALQRQDADARAGMECIPV